MKLLNLLVIITSLSVISCTSTSSNKNEFTLGDTIQTKSGLQYYYVKQGKGRKVESGSEVGTYLSLMVGDSVVWNSDSSPDSLYTFITDYSRVIKGYNEMTMLLREGDEVVAILPDSLGYGAKGAGSIIPPHATLIYDKFKVVKVSEPKGFLADTLFETLKNTGMEGMIKRYDEINTTKDSINYHRGIYQLYRFWERLTGEDMHQEAADIATYFAGITNDNWLRYNMVLSFESLGYINQAKDSLEIIIREEPDYEIMNDKLVELNEKLLVENGH